MRSLLWGAAATFPSQLLLLLLLLLTAQWHWGVRARVHMQQQPRTTAARAPIAAAICIGSDTMSCTNQASYYSYSSYSSLLLLLLLLQLQLLAQTLQQVFFFSLCDALV